MYTLKTTDKATIKVTKEQRDKIAEAIQGGAKHVFIADSLIMANAITGIYAEDAHEQTEGRLHDGTKVIKQFGEWRDARNPKIRLDPAHYPEIVRDEVMTPDEWENRRETPKLTAGEEIAQLPEGLKERKEAIMQKSFDNATPEENMH